MFNEPSEEFKYEDELSMDINSREVSTRERLEEEIIKFDYEYDLKKPLIWRFNDKYQRHDFVDEYSEYYDKKKLEDTFFIVYDFEGYICIDVGCIYHSGWDDTYEDFATGKVYWSEWRDCDFTFDYRIREHIKGKNKFDRIYHILKNLNNDCLCKNISFGKYSDSIILDGKEISYELDKELKFIDDEMKELFISEFYKLNELNNVESNF